jgi:hypothetical protein
MEACSEKCVGGRGRPGLSSSQGKKEVCSERCLSTWTPGSTLPRRQSLCKY